MNGQHDLPEPSSCSKAVRQGSVVPRVESVQYLPPLLSQRAALAELLYIGSLEAAQRPRSKAEREGFLAQDRPVQIHDERLPFTRRRPPQEEVTEVEIPMMESCVVHPADQVDRHAGALVPR